MALTSFFVDDLNDWIYNNLDIDTILDRINLVGIDSLTKIEKELGWKPSIQFEEGLEKTIKWYKDNYDKVKSLKNYFE